MEAQSNNPPVGSVTDRRAVCKPAVVVTSSVSVNLTTSHPRLLLVGWPSLELLAQQNSTSLLVVGAGSDGAAVDVVVNSLFIPFALGRPMLSSRGLAAERDRAGEVPEGKT